MKARSQHSPIKSAILALGIGLNLFVAMLTVFSAYGGTFDPETRVIAAMAAMVLPILLIAGIVIVLIDLIIDARLILMAVIPLTNPHFLPSECATQLTVG